MHWAASRAVGASEGDAKHLRASLACVASVVVSPGPCGNQLVPYDFTQGPVQCGNSGPNIYRVCMRGNSGTPMSTWRDSLSPAASWDLVHFIGSRARSA